MEVAVCFRVHEEEFERDRARQALPPSEPARPRARRLAGVAAAVAVAAVAAVAVLFPASTPAVSSTPQEAARLQPAPVADRSAALHAGPQSTPAPDDGPVVTAEKPGGCSHEL
jgi:ferric-dicitrate binding protein FerR (iron transport regulator)